MYLIKRLAFLSLFCILLSSCTTSNSASESDDKKTLVITTPVWATVYDLIDCPAIEIADIEVSVLIPNGADPHDFELSLSDRELLENADLILANGANLEEGLADTLNSLQSEGKKIFEFIEHVDDDQLINSNYEGEEGSSVDPHIWMDPKIVNETMPDLINELQETYKLDDKEASVCLETAQNKLQSLNSEITLKYSELKSPNKKIVINHPTLYYYANRYDLDIVGVVEENELIGSSIEHLKSIANTMSKDNIKTIFVDPAHSDTDSKAIADQVGAKIIQLENIELIEGSEDEYVQYLLSISETISENLN